MTNDNITFRTWIDFDEESSMFEAFPFSHRLEMEYELSTEGLKVTYSIENYEYEEIPFGLGLHPYFMKLSGDDKTYIKIPADCVMDNTSDLLPTGRLVNVDETIYDLRESINIGALDMDHVFTCLKEGMPARIDYKSIGLSVSLEASTDFTHMVLYSPRGQNYFCLENQTCSTDAHNLYERGFTKESGLKIVPPIEKFSGHVMYRISKEN